MKVSLPKKIGKKNEPKKPALIRDIAPVASTAILNLKKKLPAVQIDMGQVRAWWQLHQHKFFIILSILIGALVLSSLSTGHASIATFNPTSCLGDWEHVDKAQGEPSLPSESSPEQFSLENSARMPGSVSSIYCGGFKGTIPENSSPTTFKLTLSWSVDDASVVHTTTQPFDTATPDGTVTIPAPDATTPTDGTPVDTTDTPAPSPSDTPPSDTTPAPDVQPTDPVPAPASDVQSFLDHVFGQRVFAQETNPTVDTAPADPVSDAPVPTADAPVVDSAPTPEVAPVDTAPQGEISNNGESIVATEISPADAFMEVEYTLDGTSWKSLGTISRSGWARASFDIPLEKWENLDHLQVALKALPTFDQVPVVYLDAMTVSVEYSDLKDLVAPPTVMLTDPMIEGKQDFNSTENVTFDLTTPNLDITDIKSLVNQGKATVVKDTQGVLGDKVADPQFTQETQATIDTVKDAVQETQTIIDSPSVDITPPPVAPDTPAPAPISLLKKLFVPATTFADASDVQTSVLDQNGATTDIVANVVTTNNDQGLPTRHIEIERPERQFHPGRYTLVVTVTTPQAILVSQQDFTWGVLVINTDKSVYATGDTAYLQMGVLNDAGHTLCNSDLDLDITSPAGATTHRSTSDGSIVRAAECGPDNVINVPDYYAHFSIPDEAGTYTMRLTAHTANGVKSITDTFTAATTPTAIVERTGPSRIYPVALYPMTIRVTSPTDWNGVVTERVPASFEISQPEQSTPYDSIDTEGDTKIISWDVSLAAGEQATLGYYFNAPDISPEFYILGKASLIDSGGNTTFTETRNWQIASDAACNATASGNWATTASFTSCTGAATGGSGTGARPGVNDDLTINSGVALVGDTTVTIKSLTFAASTAATSLTINNGVTFTVTGTSTIASPGASGTNTITVGGGTSGTFSTAGLSIPGSATASRFSTLSLSGGATLTTTAGITFSGTAAQSRFTNSVAATINLTGTMSAGGTVTIASGTTITTTGTSALNGAYTYGILNVTSGTTSLGAVATIFAGLVTVSNSATLNASSATGLKTFSAGVTTNTSTAVFDLKTGSNFATATSFGGNITANGTTFNSGTGAVTITGTGTLTISGGSAVSLGGTLTIPTNKTISNTDTATVTIGALTLASPTASNAFSVSNGSITSITGQLAFTANAAAGQSQTVTINDTATISAASISMPATTSTGTAKITCATGATGSLSVTGLTSIAGSATTSGGTSSIDFGTVATSCGFSTGTLTVAGGSIGTAALIMGSGTTGISGAVTFGTAGNITRSIFTTGASAITLTGSAFGANGTLSISSATVSTSGTSAINGAYTLPTLSVTGGTTTMGAAVTVTGALSVSASAILKFGAFAFTASSTTNISGAINCPAAASCTGLKRFAGAMTVNTGGSFDLNTGTPTVAPTTSFGSDIAVNTGATAFNTGIATSTTVFTAASTLSGSVSMTFAGTGAGATTINSGVTVTNSNTGTVTFGVLTVASAASGATGMSLSDLSATVVTGALTYTANAGVGLNQNIVMNGNASLNVGSVVMNAPSNTGTAAVTCNAGSGTFTVGGALGITAGTTAGSSTVAMDTCTLAANGLVTITGGTVGVASISASTGTLNINAGITFATTLAQARITTSGAATVNFTGTMTGVGILSGIDPTATINTKGTVAVNAALTFPKLTVFSGTTTMGAAVTVTNALSVASGALLKFGAFAFTASSTTNISGAINCPAAASCTGLKTFTGAVTVNSGGDFDLLTGSPTVVPTLQFNNNITSSGTTLNTNTGATTIAASLSLLGANAMTLGAVSISSGVTLTNGNTNTVTMASLTIASPTASNGYSVSDLSNTTVTGAIIYTANATANSQTITMNGNGSIGAASITINRPTVNAAQSNITCATNATGTLSTSGIMSFQGAATTTGTLNIIMNTCNLTAGDQLTLGGGSTGGNITLTTTTGVLTASNGVNFSGTTARNNLNVGTGNFNLTGAMVTGGTVSINSGNTLIATGTSSITGAYTFGKLSVPSGTLSLGAVAITFAGTTDLTGGTLNTATGTGLKTFSGAVTVTTGTFDMSGQNPTLSFGAGITMNGTTFNAGSGATAFTASQNLAGGAAMTFGGAVTISSAQTLTNNNTSTVDFNSTITGGNSSSNIATGLNSTTRFGGTVMSTGTLTPGTSANTIEYDGGTQTIKAPSTNPYYNLTISAAGVKSLAASTTVTGTTTISAGSLDTVSGSNFPLITNDLTIGASGTLLGQNATITVTRNWTNSGAFTAGTSTVLMNGATTATVSGATAFYDLTITHTAAKEVDFQTSGAPTFDVTHTFTVTGSAGNLIKLYSDSTPTQWIIHPTGTAAVDYADVRDGACASGSIPITPTHFTNSGNNGSCWLPTSLTFAINISDPTIGFGALSSTATTYATGDTLGSSTEVEAFNLAVATNAASGYTLSVLGPTLTKGASTIAAIGGTNTAPSVGTEQFGMRLTATGGLGTVSSPYDGSGFAYAASSTVPDAIASATSGDSVTTTYSARFMCNISPTTPAGQYDTSLTYVLTGNF